MNLKTVDLNLLIAFDVLISERSVSRAAEKLGVTQPAVSHALKRLRYLFKDDLLTRGPNGMQPTGRALSLHPGVQSVLADIRSIVSTRQRVRFGNDIPHLPPVDERRNERRGPAVDCAPHPP